MKADIIKIGTISANGQLVGWEFDCKGVVIGFDIGDDETKIAGYTMDELRTIAKAATERAAFGECKEANSNPIRWNERIPLPLPDYFTDAAASRALVEWLSEQGDTIVVEFEAHLRRILTPQRIDNGVWRAIEYLTAPFSAIALAANASLKESERQ